MDTETKEKLEKMKAFIGEFDHVIVAFSGGVDSSTLAAVCKKVLNENVLAVTIRSQNIPSREIRDAEEVAREIGVAHEFIDIDVLSVDDFRKNSEQRCYYCKKHILSALVMLAEERNFDAVFEGTNASDLGEHRPGYRAVEELEKVYSPWAEFGITKDEIKMIARYMGFSFYDKPSLACLATRIPFGVEINEKALRMIDRAEDAVVEIAKVRQARVRNLNGVAVIEVGSDEVHKVLPVALEIKEKLMEIGFRSVLLDLEGYRTGKISLYSLDPIK